MKWPLITLRIEQEDDVVSARQRARQVAEQLGFGVQDQTRIATAVSEIARNAFSYAAGGKVEYSLDSEAGRQRLVIKISDAGPGISDLNLVLSGNYQSPTGLGIGITGARRLMDDFNIQSEIGKGTAVNLAKELPQTGGSFTPARVSQLAKSLAQSRPADAQAALREQNRELLQSLAALSEREAETQRLNDELANTNRGVVALHAELELQAVKLREAGATLEAQVAARTSELAEANARLVREARERERMEADLRQAQKMEAVGQLTGGIAHDFNNLLTGILGSLDLVKTRMARGRTENFIRYIDTAMTSANRAAALTHRLLAFARRQPLDPKPTDVNALVLGMSDLLRRTIPESIDLRIEIQQSLWLTLCDPHQLENALLNLAINARDAMPGGGAITLAASNTVTSQAKGSSSNDFVCISVTDTGTGMPPDVIARAFDPFFTTKPMGQGTGLGLSMIYGFARQSDGYAQIESEVGKGSTVTLCLPRYSGHLLTRSDLASSEDVAAGRGETILIVEDEQSVRDVIAEVLLDMGYSVLQATDGPGGLKILQSDAHIDLLVTDVGLPGINGRQLADHARVARVNLGVLFITGYAEDAAASSGFLGNGMEILVKPFTTDILKGRVQSMMSSSIKV